MLSKRKTKKQILAASTDMLTILAEIATAKDEEHLRIIRANRVLPLLTYINGESA